MTAAKALDYDSMSEPALVERVVLGDALAVRTVTARNNQRLYRAAWSILKNRAEAEEAVQDAYLKAFVAIEGFQGASSLSTWLTRIVINESLSRRRASERRRRAQEGESVAFIEQYREAMMQGSNPALTPETAVLRKQIAGLLEQALARLPDAFRLVFVLREIEDLSVEETAEVLGISAPTVKTRLHRAKRRLQLELDPDLAGALTQTFPFAGADCEALTARVLARMGLA